MLETWVRSLGREDPLEKEMATHSSILAWRIPWTEELGWLLSMGSQRVGHDWATSLSLWNPVFLCVQSLFGHVSHPEHSSPLSLGWAVFPHHRTWVLYKPAPGYSLQPCLDSGTTPWHPLFSVGCFSHPFWLWHSIQGSVRILLGSDIPLCLPCLSLMQASTWLGVVVVLIVSDSVWPCGLQPTRLLCPWNFPGRNTGGRCYFLLQGPSWPRDWNLHLSCIVRRILHHGAIWEVPFSLAPSNGFL